MGITRNILQCIHSALSRRVSLKFNSFFLRHKVDNLFETLFLSFEPATKNSNPKRRTVVFGSGTLTDATFSLLVRLIPASGKS